MRVLERIRVAARRLATQTLGEARLERFHVRREALARAAERIVDDPRFERVVIWLILLNAAILGLNATPSVAGEIGETLMLLDEIILALFVVELTLRIIARGRAFFRSGWSWFDLVTVAVSYAPDASGLSALRTLRVFRVLRLFSVVPAMRRVIVSFFRALPSMAGVLGALGVIFYVSAIITTTVFGQADPTSFETPPAPEDLEMMHQLFGTMERSFFTLFQLMTLENWVDGVVAPTMRLFPNALLFFGPYIVLTSFAILNLFIGVIVEAMQHGRDEAEEARDEAQTATLAALMTEVQALRADLAAQSGSGGAEKD